MEQFHGEEVSTVAAEVDPQHLAPNDAMIFHQTVMVCGDLAVTGGEQIIAEAEYRDPVTREQKLATTTVTVDELLKASDMLLKKGQAIVAYAEALKDVQELMYFTSNYEAIRQILTDALNKVEAAKAALADPELDEIATLITTYRSRFN
jgi:Ca-activated chloride channel family protein